MNWWPFSKSKDPKTLRMEQQAEVRARQQDEVDARLRAMLSRFGQDRSPPLLEMEDLDR